jgi:hypothetical protein
VRSCASDCDGKPRVTADLARPPVASKLDDSFMRKAEAMQPASAKLAPERGERQLAVERNALDPSMKAPPPPNPQIPNASSQAMAWKLKPS